MSEVVRSFEMKTTSPKERRQWQRELTIVPESLQIMGKMFSRGGRSDYRILRRHGAGKWNVFANTLPLMVRGKEFRTRCGLWLGGSVARLRQRRGAVVRYLWHDAGTGSTENDYEG